MEKVNNLHESINSYNRTNALRVISSLKRNKIPGYYFDTVQDANKYIIEIIPVGSKVASGGSLTLEQLGLISFLKDGDYNYIDRSKANSDEELFELRMEGLKSDFFLMSANALTVDGKIVCIDGTGNRVGALVFGPKKVIVIAGINKIVADMEAAVYKIKNFTVPIHSKRRGRLLPCTKTGYCVDCNDAGRICNKLVCIENQYDERISVIIIGQELGL